jgi:hypothetical protein
MAGAFPQPLPSGIAAEGSLGSTGPKKKRELSTTIMKREKGNGKVRAPIDTYQLYIQYDLNN